MVGPFSLEPLRGGCYPGPMNLVTNLRPLAGKVRRLVSPYPRLIPAQDYWAIRRLPPFVSGSARVLGQDVRFSCREGFLHSVQEIFVDEVYLFKAASDAPRIIDAGANIGLSVLYFKHLYPKCRLTAFEPDPAIFKLLQANVGALPGVELHEAAAWTEDTTLTFYPTGSLAGSTEVDFTAKGEAIRIKAERLRDEIAKGPVDFLKIDIEGAENQVLFDIADQLGSVDHLFLEYHSNPEKPQLLGEMLTVVKDAGFRYFINGAHAPWRPYMDTVESGFDLQLNISCKRA